MKRFAICSAFLLVCTLPLAAQNNDVKFIADTLVVQADGTYEADPDLATLTFDISSQDKELKPAYENASQAMQKIVALAAKNDVKKEDVSSGVLTVVPYYSGDWKKTREIISRAGTNRYQGARFLKAWRDPRGFRHKRHHRPSIAYVLPRR